MKEILVPVDFSEAALNAVQYAGNLARQLESEVVLYYVNSLRAQAIPDVITGTHLSTEYIEERLRQLSLSVASEFSIRCVAEVEKHSFNSISESIGKKASDFDLMIVGTNGADELGQLIAGSVAYRVAMKADIPVLIVPVGFPFRPFKAIAFAYDYLRNRTIPEDQLLKIVTETGASVAIVQVMEEAQSIVMEQDLKELQFIISQRTTLKIPLDFQTLRSSDAAKALLQFVSEGKTDVLALCSSERNFFESLFAGDVIRELTATPRLPLLIVHH